MMYLLKKARIYDERSPHHLKKMDLLIRKGTIEDIGQNITHSDARKLEATGLSISPAWIDTGSFCGEPGKEHREDLKSLRAAGANGGFGRLLVFPNTEPCIDSRGLVEFILKSNSNENVQLLPMGALTRNCEGTDMAEIMDLAQAGALAFSDGFHCRYSKAQMTRLLQYVSSRNKLLVHHLGGISPAAGQVHEGAVSVEMGLEGLPVIEEHMEVASVRKILSYVGGSLLLHCISDFEKEGYLPDKGEDLSYSVSYLNLLFQDRDLIGFRGELKHLPPMRGEANRRHLIKAVKKGEIGIICSNHRPLSREEYDEPFGMRPFGISSLETLFPALNTIAEELDTECIIRALTYGPAELFGLPCFSVEKGSTGSFTVFDTDGKTHVNESFFKSRSHCNPFLGQDLKGRVLALLTPCNQELPQGLMR